MICDLLQKENARVSSFDVLLALFLLLWSGSNFLAWGALRGGLLRSGRLIGAEARRLSEY